MKNRILGLLSIIALFSTIFIETTTAQAFEKTYNNSVGKTIAKGGNLIRVETCEDSSRVDLLFDQEGNLVRTERNFRGSCELERLADGTFITKTFSTNSAGRTVGLTKNLRPDGTLISSKTLVYPLGNSYISDKNGSFMFSENPYVANVNSTKYMVNRYDSVGNRLTQYVLDTALLGGQYIYYYKNSEHIYAYKKAYNSYDIFKIWKFDRGGNLLATIPYNRGCQIIESNTSGTKLLFTGGNCTSVCVPNSLNFMDSDNGETVATMPIVNDNLLLYRSNAIHADNNDNVYVVAANQEPCFGRICRPTYARLTVMKFSKDGKLIFRKDYYHSETPLVFAKDFVINDDRSIVIMGSKDNKLWLLKLNCAGESVPTVPVAMPFAYGDYFGTSKAWIRSTSINNATISTLDSFTFNGFKSYSLFKTPLTTLQRGQTYPLSITVKTDSIQNLSKTFAGIWFDFNRNGQFDSTERIALTKNNDVYSGTFQVPNNAAKGLVNVKARVRLNQQTFPIAYENEGETEDYFVTIEGTNANSCDNDTEAPTLRCPNTYTTNDTSKMVLPRPSFQDNCTDSANIIIAATYADSFKFPVGRTSVTYSATDRNCNTSTCRFDVDVRATISPDLTLANVNFRDPSVYRNGIAYFSFDAKNIGTGNATNAFTIKSYLSIDRVLDASDYQNGVISTANYPAGANLLQIQGAMRLESNLYNFYKDKYFLILKIDADNQITESNENNNVVASFDPVNVLNNTTCRFSDSLQLVNLYNATNGANWTTKWDLFTPLNTWFGVVLNADGCVDAVDLINNNLAGTIPNLNLSKITVLRLYGNFQLTGAIPNFNLPNLTNLSLDINQLSGAIPNFNLPNLISLSLSGNQLTGSIPNFLMPKLSHLDLGGNQLDGSIPNFNLPQLVVMELSRNKLTGRIPPFNLPKATTVFLKDNQLSGQLPYLILPQLTGLVFGFNQLSGCIPLSYKNFCGKFVSLVGNPNLATQDFTAFCSTANTGACTVGTYDLSFIESQKIHPTITENNIELELESTEDKQIDVDIINTLGNIVFKKHLKILKGNNQLNFDVENLPNGLYFIQTSVGNRRNVPMKFVKF